MVLFPKMAVLSCYSYCWLGGQTDDANRIRDYVIQHVNPGLVYLPKTDHGLVCILPAYPRWGNNKPGNRESSANE